MNPILQRYKGGLPFSVQERDIDLLLIELLHTSDSFASVVLDRLGLPAAEVISVAHSVYREHGETDVLVIARYNGLHVALMIEDKIGAPMQPGQCERYHLRGQALCEKGEADRYFTVLCAPRSYCETVPKDQRWDFRVSLEELASVINAASVNGCEWKEAILIGASSKQSRAKLADSRSAKAYDGVISTLKSAYRTYVLANFPQLTATRQEGGDREYFIGAIGLPSGIRFKHAFFRGEVSLIFEKSWADLARCVLATLLPEGCWSVQHGSEFHIRTAVEVMDPQLPFESQENVAATALRKIEALVALAQRVAKERP